MTQVSSGLATKLPPGYDGGAVAMLTALESSPEPRLPALPASAVEWLLEAIALLALLAPVVLILEAWPELPDRVPRHFNAAGEPNAWSGRLFVWFLPVVSLFTYLLMTLTSRNPHWGNVPVEVTPENADRVYANVRSMMVWLKALMSIMFAHISVRTLEVAQGAEQGLGSWFLPAILLGTAAITGIHLWLVRKSA